MANILSSIPTKDFQSCSLNDPGMSSEMFNMLVMETSCKLFVNYWVFCLNVTSALNISFWKEIILLILINNIFDKKTELNLL